MADPVYRLNESISIKFHRLQFEVLDSPSDSSLKNQLTNAYDEYLENWVGDYWLQPKYLPKGFKVS